MGLKSYIRRVGTQRLCITGRRVSISQAKRDEKRKRKTIQGSNQQDKEGKGEQKRHNNDYESKTTKDVYAIEIKECHVR